MPTNFMEVDSDEGTEHRKELLEISSRINELSARSESGCNVTMIRVKDTVQSLSHVKFVTDEIRGASTRGTIPGMR